MNTLNATNINRDKLDNVVNFFIENDYKQYAVKNNTRKDYKKLSSEVKDKLKGFIALNDSIDESLILRSKHKRINCQDEIEYALFDGTNFITKGYITEKLITTKHEVSKVVYTIALSIL